MPFYEYTAKSINGETKKGKMQAKSEGALAQALKSEGYFLIAANLPGSGFDLKKFLPKVKYVPLEQKLLVTRNLQVMVVAGVPLPRALEVLEKQVKSHYFKKALKETRAMVLRGTSLSKAISQYPKVFPDIYVSLVKVGEKTGELGRVLGILTGQLERSYRLRSRIRGAMMYPAVIVSAMLLIGAVMMVKVVPELSKTFEELEVELPPLSKAVIFTGNFFAENWMIGILILVFLSGLLYVFLKSKSGKRFFHKLNLKLPIISPLVKKINSAYSALSLSALMKGGVPVVSALNIASNSVTNMYYRKAFKETAKKVEKGKKISQTIAHYPNLFSPLFVQMLQVGEETGQASEMLEKLAHFLEEQVNNTTKNLSSIIEPILLLVIGIAVGFFAIAMIQPIYSIMQNF